MKWRRPWRREKAPVEPTAAPAKEWTDPLDWQRDATLPDNPNQRADDDDRET